MTVPSASKVEPFDDVGKDSVFFNWKIKTAWSKCNVAVWVSSLEQLMGSGKHYAAKGNVRPIKVWNVSSQIR
jgi:hypothetical protein